MIDADDNNDDNEQGPDENNKAGYDPALKGQRQRQQSDRLRGAGPEFAVGQMPQQSVRVTDQCVEGAVRDACDEGYLVTLITDACATYSADRHANSLKAIRGYCRQRTTDEFLREIGAA